jgi:DNA repair exonuclease SbcCD ATPase subunit
MGATQQQVYSFALSYGDLKQAAENANNAVFTGRDGMDGMDESVSGLDGSMSNLSGTTDGLTGSMDGLANATDGATSSLNGNINAAEILFGVTSDEIQVLQNAIAVFQALSGQQGLSAQQSGLLAQATSILAAQYPQLNGQIAENIGWISSQVGMMSSLSDVSGANAATMIANQNSTTKATISQINQRILGYQKEAQALSALMERIEASYDERGLTGASSNAYHNAAKRLDQINAELATAQSSKIEAYYSSGVSTGQVKPYNGSSGGSGGSKSGSGSGSSSSKQDPISPYQIDKYEQAQRQLNMTLAESKARMDAVTESSQAYRNELALQSSIYQDQAKGMRDEIARLEQRNGVIKRQIAQWGDFNKMQRWQQQAYNDLTKEMEDNEKQIESLTSAQYDLQGQIRDTTKAYQDSINKQKEEIGNKANDFIDMYKQFYEQKKELDQKALDDELSDYEKMVNEKLALIDKQENQNTYNKDLASKQKEIADIQSQINLFSMDSTQAGKVSDLQKQLADKQVELSDFLHQHDVDQRKQALNDELESKRSEIEQKKKLSEQYYDDLLNDERKFAEMRDKIMQGNITDFQSMLGDFSKYLQDHMKDIGTSITENLIDKIAQASDGLKQAQTDVENMSKVYGGSDLSISGTDTSKVDNVTIISDTPVLKKNGDGTYEATGTILKKGQVFKAYGINSKDGVYAVGGGWITADPKYTKYQKFDTGGLTHGEGLAYLHDKEIILNKMDTPNLLKAVDITRSIANMLPKFSMPKLLPKNDVMPQPNISLNINIANLNGGKEGADSLFKEINNRLRGKGGFAF